MDKFYIGEFRQEYYPDVIRIRNEIYPSHPITVDELVYYETHWGKNIRSKRIVALQEEKVVGSAIYKNMEWDYHPKKFFIDIEVLPNRQRSGIGSRLYIELCLELSELGAISIQTETRENFNNSIRFLEDRGFKEIMREKLSIINIDNWNAVNFSIIEKKMANKGIEIKTFKELENDPDRDKKLYDLDKSVIPYLPGVTTIPDFNTWKDDVIYNPNILPDAYFLAVHKNKYVGISNLLKMQASAGLEVGLTAVRKEYWRMGIATALKIKGLIYAKTKGIPFIETGNEANNTTILSINKKLGFVQEPDAITYEKK